ncbi:hypothetical protein GCM10020295_25400 [Streptomyces cinereospinus]
MPYADVVCATTHKVLRGPRGGMILCSAELAGRVDRAVFPFTQGGAQMHTVAAKAVAFGEAATPAFRAYAHQVVANARALAAALTAEGLGVTTGGTDTHLITADPAPLGVDGRAARGRSPPPESCWTAVRCRTPTPGACAWAPRRSPRRAWGRGEMTRIAKLIAGVLRDQADSRAVREEVRELAGGFPPYPR